MFRFFRTLDSLFYPVGDRLFVLDVSRLQENERLQFKYDHNKKLVAIQKIKLSLFGEPMEAIAETDILPGAFGRVYYQGRSWKACCEEQIKITTGQPVLVIAKHELTLLIIPADNSYQSSRL